MIKVGICLRGAVAKINGAAFFTQGSLYRPGDYINFKACHKSIVKHIVEANADCSFDFFIHSWNEDLKNDLNCLYNPKKSLFENNSLYNEEINKKVREPNEFTGISHALSIKKSIELSEDFQKENNFKYDLIIVYRPDLILLKDMDLKKYNPENIYVNGSTPPDPVGDFHFVMSPENANQFKHLYDGVELGNPCKHHFWIKNYINNFMHKELILDDITAGIYQEVLRKANVIMINGKGVPLEKFLEYGLTKEEILQYNYA